MKPELNQTITLSLLDSSRFYIVDDLVVHNGYCHNKRDAFIRLFNLAVYQLAGRTTSLGTSNEYWKTVHLGMTTKLPAKELFERFFPLPDNDDDITQV